MARSDSGSPVWPGAARAEGRAAPASKPRPICLLSAFWRTYMSACVSSSEATQWLNAQLQPSQSGGRKGRRAQSAFVPVAEQYALKRFICSLHLSTKQLLMSVHSVQLPLSKLSKPCGAAKKGIFVGTKKSFPKLGQSRLQCPKETPFRLRS